MVKFEKKEELVMLKRGITLGELIAVCVTIFIVMMSTYVSMRVETANNTDRIVRLEQAQEKIEVREQRRDDVINNKLDKMDTKLDRLSEVLYNKVDRKP